MMSEANRVKLRNSNICDKELEESVRKLIEEVGYNDSSEDETDIIISTEFINRNLLAFLKINSKANKIWYNKCLKEKEKYWEKKMKFWNQFEIYTWSELFFGEKTRGIDQNWKNKMWDIWFTYIHRIMWMEDVEDTKQFKKRIEKCYSYIYISNKYTKKKRHFEKVKQKKILNAWNHFINSNLEKWQKERKAAAEPTKSKSKKRRTKKANAS
ncbi:Plasmodium exported protein, unknown function [Plasmodium gonderi]|uniref:Uncharacterized protein n=1 Tax=Plasmodium gonderi TaxID=77519 RepID=A0A1Y1JD26_PLAGO|nr:Plasmodium exported protein, unknown function [Plasmodium gonderi]GAW80419.1 Plasmodium exported protein, unknown function [Plasmodium gonderi]